jgi:hypothetical protein
MKNLYILSTILLFSVLTIQSSAQKAPKQKADTTKPCKPTKSGKHCAKPSKG